MSRMSFFSSIGGSKSATTDPKNKAVRLSEDYRILPNDVQFLEKIGNGGAGVTRSCRHDYVQLASTIGSATWNMAGH